MQIIKDKFNLRIKKEMKNKRAAEQLTKFKYKKNDGYLQQA